MLNRAAVFLGMALGAAAWSGCSPYGGGAFTCTSDQQCMGNGKIGKCEPNSLCSFEDLTCTSHQRYGELSGALANKCVGDEPDAGVDTPMGGGDAPDGQVSDALSCYGAGLVNDCFTMPLTGTVTIPSGTLNTGSSGMCSTQFSTECVIAAGDITVASGTLNVIGPKPLVLIAATTIMVTGTIDVASHRGGNQGAASDLSGCNAGTGPGNNGGGAGGSFAAVGGDGGGANKGSAGGTIAATLRGGCPGQSAPNSPGGHGGGAVYLIANGSITVTGGINASGASAVGGNGTTGGSGNGAGGGGSGGLIVFDSPTVTGTGSQIFANGGAGGEGASSGGGTNGNPGTDSPNPTTAAIGGNNGTGSGGDGGNGSVTATLIGSTGATGTPSGGGGGGSAGVIKLFRASTINGGSVSPPATP
jgi:hypothetical protein